MNIDYLIESERKKAEYLGQTVSQKAMQQIREYGFFTVSIEHEQNLENNGLSIVLHGPPIKEKLPLVFHNHDYYEMVYVYHGGCINTFRDNQVIMSRGDVLLLNPDVLHSVYTTQDKDCVFNIMLSRTLFEESMLMILSDNKLLSNFITSYMYQINSSQDYLYFPAQENGQADDIMTNLIYELLERPLGSRNIIQHLLVALFALLARIHAEENQINSEMQSQISLLPDIISYIYRNSKTVNLSVLKEKFAYSTGYISRIIKQHCGQSFTQLVQNAKLQHARDILKTTDISIVLVAEESGFQDDQYFSKIFKRKFGLSPSKYRRFSREQ